MISRWLDEGICIIPNNSAMPRAKHSLIDIRIKFGDVLLTAGTLDLDCNSRRSFLIITNSSIELIVMMRIVDNTYENKLAKIFPIKHWPFLQYSIISLLRCSNDNHNSKTIAGIPHPTMLYLRNKEWLVFVLDRMVNVEQRSNAITPAHTLRAIAKKGQYSSSKLANLLRNIVWKQ